MKEPTQEQTRVFWEGYGFHLGGIPDFPNTKEVMTVYWVSPNDEPCDLPPIDLNNLFKYAVPKVHSCELETLSNLGEDGYEAWVNYGVPNGFEGYSAKDEDPALALFWALDKVRNDT